jgi:hypothetical protein
VKRLVVLTSMLFASVSLAEVGKVTVLDGKASRAPKGGAAVALAVGTPIELGDTVLVESGSMKFELTDGSVIALADKAKLLINEAEFEGQERKGFSAFLEAGKLWTKVKKAVGGAKYEVTTERAVAGVRGTIFRIDADVLVQGARRATAVRVVEGIVRVNPSAEVARRSKGAVPAALAKGPRKQVAGPTEISVEDWEKKFVELQANSQVLVGVDLWEQAELDQKSKNDKFQKWLDAQK